MKAHKSSRSISLFLAAFMLALVVFPAVADNDPVDPTFTYQGRLTLQGEPVSGEVDLIFRLYDDETDGALLGELFADGYVLGDDGLLTIDLNFGDGVFTGAARWLEISVNDTTLSPRQPIMVAPYALVANSAVNVPTKALTGNYPGITGVGTLGSLDVGGNVFVSSSNIPIRGVRDAASGSFPGIWGETYSASSNGSGVRGYANHTTPGATAAGVWGRSLSETDNGIGVRGTHDADGIGVKGESATGFGGYFIGKGYFSDRVGLGTESPSARLHVTGDDSLVLARFHHTGTGNSRALAATTDGSGYAAFFEVLPGASAGALYAATNGTGRAASFESHQSNDTAAVSIFKNGGPALQLSRGLGGGTPDAAAVLNIRGGTDSEPDGGGFLVLGSTTSTNISIDNNEIMARNDGAPTTLFLNHNGGQVRIGQGSGGTGRLLTPVLQITGGSDLSEQFDVAAVGDLTPEPGMVVCIDPANPGNLIPSTRAYDRTVAGVISGANGINSGMVMGQEGTVADGAYPVALTGRVYVLADGSTGAIEPGELLTTSDTPGHAQRVNDYARAQGAIIGKAMTPLAQGERGLVLVLVNLQ